MYTIRFDNTLLPVHKTNCILVIRYIKCQQQIRECDGSGFIMSIMEPLFEQFPLKINSSEIMLHSFSKFKWKQQSYNRNTLNNKLWFFLLVFVWTHHSLFDSFGAEHISRVKNALVWHSAWRSLHWKCLWRGSVPLWTGFLFREVPAPLVVLENWNETAKRTYSI